LWVVDELIGRAGQQNLPLLHKIRAVDDGENFSRVDFYTILTMDFTITLLHSESTRSAFLDPVRWCGRQWKRFYPRETGLNKTVQLVLLIIPALLLLIATGFATLIGFLGAEKKQTTWRVEMTPELRARCNEAGFISAGEGYSRSYANLLSKYLTTLSTTPVKHENIQHQFRDTLQPIPTLTQELASKSNSAVTVINTLFGTEPDEKAAKASLGTIFSPFETAENPLTHLTRIKLLIAHDANHMELHLTQ
jgi:hypothetical protein